MNPGDQIINIIAKELNGHATPQELGQLRQWLESDPANRREYEELVTLWQESSRIVVTQTFNTNAAWSRVASKIESPTADNAPARQIGFFSSLYRNRMALAAALIGLFIIGGFLWNHYRTSWQELTADANTRSLRLPDGSIVSLRKGATIRYPLHFDGEERLIRLSGEAYFNVQRNEQQPFVIVTGNTAVKVLGTTFLVHSEKETDEIIVMTGKVSVTNKNKASQQVELTAGQRTILRNDQFLQSQVSDSNFIAWNTGLLDFKNAPLEKVLEEMQDYYEVPISLDSQQKTVTSPFNITVRFNNQPLDQALEEIRLITGLEMKKEGSKIVFYMK